MSDIVIVPTYYRPEYLHLCLEHLMNAGAANDKRIWLCQDMRFEDQHRHQIEERWLDELLSFWRERLPIELRRRKQHGFAGNSCNVMEAYKEAYDTDARFVYLVEEDVLVTPDFFRWHEAVAALGPHFCSIAYRCSRNGDARTDISNPQAYFTTARDYASIGVCWRRETLGPIVAHANPEYYRDMEAYILKTFPGNRFAGDFCEQDGLIMRVMWEQRGVTVWPYVPRCYHMGWYGYHRPHGIRPNGQLQEKISALRASISDPAVISQVARDFGDIEPYRLHAAGTGPLVQVQHFD